MDSNDDPKTEPGENKPGLYVVIRERRGTGRSFIATLGEHRRPELTLIDCRKLPPPGPWEHTR